MKFFPKTVITMIIIFGSNPVYGFLSCPQTEQQYQTWLFRQGGVVSSEQNKILLKQCYEEVKLQFEQEIRNRYGIDPSPSFGMGGVPPMKIPGMGTPGMGIPGMGTPGTENRICSNGLYQGRIVDPNMCLMGQGAEMMEKFMRAFGSH
uniref:Uncharacterized protein n=1 Tax=Candidatus Kentrum sp. TUN TaxID=2126343 RepID=A0A450ZJK6_9GAMM|nr:MAG: hypothetical protein BECKTUN1418F_GA0071002_103311 [Candidatus Kentron sp. TUN]VFK55877.1 MAG: hypothetical protein BECKTUN1418E_GA0071001_103411 [Candidatus Kentron sp. TUN]